MSRVRCGCVIHLARPYSHHGSKVRSRLIPDSLKNLEEMLSWTGLSPDEGPSSGGKFAPYKQSERLEVYHESMKHLLKDGSCYHCFCTPQRLEFLRKNAVRNKETPRYDNKCRSLSEAAVKENKSRGTPHVIRLKIEPNADPYDDLILGTTCYDVGRIEGDPVMIKADGFPTYHFANVVDDHLMEITHVLRGQEWIMSTNKHILLYKAFGWKPPTFAHLPLALNKDGRTKLSKRFGNNTYVSHFKETGVYPGALLNFLTFCGGGFEDHRQILTLPEMVAKFSLDKISNHSAILDLDLLPGVNQSHLIKRFQEDQGQRKLLEELREEVRRAFQVELPNEAFLYRILDLRKNHINYIKDLTSKENYYLWIRPKVTQHDLSAITAHSESVIKAIYQDYANTCEEVTTTDDVNKYLQRIHKKTADVPWPTFMKVIRMCLSGKKEGPSVADMMVMLGSEEFIERLKCGLMALTER
ncbi:hypothetical protein BSL78_22267 [Apostichopus japonicus]|uniref:Uncharacterized protein n=1 Tax=Stichopus japonicus TaxID=307972 RepID=A0A2G8JYT8_STIJA|nr:hypothetical protein BSL78_22267 [Apostichopus japonicus]